MAQTATNRLKYLLVSGGITTSTDIRMGLLKQLAGHTNVADLNTVADLEAHADFAELTGVTEYQRQAVTTKTVTEVDASDWALFDFDDVPFGVLSSGGTIVGWFLYVYNASDASADLLGVGDLTSTPTNGSTFTVTTAAGLIKLT